MLYNVKASDSFGKTRLRYTVKAESVQQAIARSAVLAVVEGILYEVEEKHAMYWEVHPVTKTEE